MRLVEKHKIKESSIYFKEIDAIAFNSKNLYNKALYTVRQEFILNGKYLNYLKVNAIAKDWGEYKLLGAMQAQQTLKLLHQNWVSFFEARKAYKLNPNKFLGPPKIPKYKKKDKGRFPVVFTNQRVSKPKLKQGVICPSKTSIEIKTGIDIAAFQCVRFIPSNKHYIAEVVYTQEPIVCETLDKNKVIGIDVGLNNLAAIAGDIEPTIINGKPLKAINQYYNKKKAQLQSKLPRSNQKFQSSHAINRLTDKRNNKVNDYLHKASRKVIDLCLANDVSRIVIGKNENWKQELNLGKRNNQQFTQIPFARFIDMISYKAELVGIEVLLTEESYTSKCSFIDNESLERQLSYKGKRVKRGLFRTALGRLINADVNGALNIIRKVASEFNIFNKDVEALVVGPKLVSC